VLLEVQAFCERVERDVNGLVDELQDLTGRTGDAERTAWRASLTKVSTLLAKPELAGFRECHLHLAQRGGLSIEYRLPASSSWCDVVLLGRGEHAPSAVILELKDWDTAGDMPGPSESLVWHRGALALHPADQVRGYTSYCRRFHSAVLEAGATVIGAVYFTRAAATQAYVSPPHDELVAEYPVFSDASYDVDQRLPQFLTTHLTRPDVDFAQRFERGVYRQDRAFCQQMANQIMDPTSSPFEMLDQQRRGFEVCLAAIREAMEHADPRDGRTVVIIEGPPGSGKSVIAACLWAALVRERIGNIVVTTTSASQRSNWENLFKRSAQGPEGAGVVIPANRYTPQSTVWVGKHGKQHPLSPDTWRDNVAYCRTQIGGLLCPDNSFLVSIVDEAHALMNPEHPKARVGVTGWPSAFGPQAFHIIRASRVSIFLMDSDQGFRDRETTTKEEIRGWAAEQNARVIDDISLAESQFRAAGLTEYIDWLDGCLGLRDLPSPTIAWRRTAANSQGKFLFEVVDDPQALDEALRPHLAAGDSARLVTAYGRRWRTKKVVDPHALPAEECDFHISFSRNGQPHRWTKVWNYAPGGDYTLFVQAPPGTKMHEDPLCEVGCPYVVRGFDYGYLGVLWLKDLIWRHDQWRFDAAHIHESGLALTKAWAKKERGADGTESRELLHRLQQVYRILLSRALKGVYVWFEDEDTRRYVESILPT
jgi:uncharacterized protein